MANKLQNINKIVENKILTSRSIYEYKINNINGENINFNKFSGKKILIVNIASKCGFKSQLKGLQKLHEIYEDNLVIIGVPSNDFMNQEPKNNQQIQAFCKRNYGVDFILTEKTNVKGKKIHPLFLYLSDINLNGINNKAPSWNFNKYLINEKGYLIDVFGSSTKPLSKRITIYLDII